MRRPNGWASNPKALASVSLRKEYNGHPELGNSVDADTWLTPRWILKELGTFDFDPCPCPTSLQWVAVNYAADGLLEDWRGRVFMNPPFSKTAHWLERHAHYADGISLVPASVESNVWQRFVWPRARGIFLFAGRTRFCNPDSSVTTGRPLRSIALIAWTAADLDVLSRANFSGVLLTSWSSRGVAF